MSKRVRIDQYDLVEVVLVPEEYRGVMDAGDVGVVLEKYDEKTFQVECVQPGGYSKWLAKLNIKYVRLRSKDPYNKWAKESQDKSIMQKSVILGSVLGIIFGAVIGGAFGAITATVNGILVGAVIGLVLGLVVGIPTAALTARFGGTTGGVSIGAYTGMGLGVVLGMIIGALIPTSLRMSANTQGMPVLDALMLGRFETAMLCSFLLSILGTIVGGWVGGKNLVPRDLKK